MDLATALDIVIARTGHARYRQLCDPADPAHDPAYPPWIIAQAEVKPTLIEQAGNFVVAVGQHIAAGWTSADPAAAAARLAICRTCPRLDGDSCRLCGCNMPIKVTWLEQVCPDGKW